MTEPRIDKPQKPARRKSTKPAPASAKLASLPLTMKQVHKKKKIAAATAKALAQEVGYMGQPDTYTMVISGPTSDPQVIVDPTC